MDLTERLMNGKDKIVLLFGFILVFSFGFFSGYFYLTEKNNENEKVAIEEPSDQCLNLIKTNSVFSDLAGSEENAAQDSFDNSKSASEEKKGIFVASKNSRIFHKPDCSYAQKIKEENKIWFSSEKEAENKGYSRDSHCFK